MRTRILIAAMSAAMLLPAALPACKQGDSSKTKPLSPEQAHQREMLDKSFTESKKVTALKVNGVAITEYYVLREMNAAAPRYLTARQQKTPDLDARIRRDAINILITQELAVQEARKRGIQIQPAVIEDALQTIRAQQGSERAFHDYLGSTGLTGEELKRVIENELLFERIASLEIDKKIDLSDPVLKERYNREKAGMTDAAHRQMTFEEAKGMLEQQLRAEATEKRVKAWEKELRKNAMVEIIRP